METRHVAATAATSPRCARSRLKPAPSGALDRGFLGEHDGNVVPHGIDALALLATQSVALLDQLHRGLADGTREDLQQVGMNGHARSLPSLSRGVLAAHPP